jgi:hypothetical protein
MPSHAASTFDIRVAVIAHILTYHPHDADVVERQPPGVVPSSSRTARCTARQE